MKPVVVRQVILLGELAPFVGPLRRVGAMVHTDAVAVVHHAAAISLRGVFSHHILIRPLIEFWIGAQRGFVKQPIARTVVIGIGHFVDPRILEELTPGVSVYARPLYVGDEAILDLNFSSRKMARVIRRAGG